MKDLSSHNFYLNFLYGLRATSEIEFFRDSERLHQAFGKAIKELKAQGIEDILTAPLPVTGRFQELSTALTRGCTNGVLVPYSIPPGYEFSISKDYANKELVKSSEKDLYLKLGQEFWKAFFDNK